MSWLGGTFLGISYLNGYQGQPIPKKYNKIRIYGEGIYDNIHIRNFTYTQEDIVALSMSVQPIWDGNTIILAQFNNKNLEIGNITGLTEKIDFWEINRRELGGKILTKLATIPVSQDTYIDITAKPNKVYEYVVFGLSDNQISEPLLSSQVKSNFYNHLLIDPDTNRVFIFDLNAQTDSIENKTNTVKYESPFSKFPAFAEGMNDYLTGGISAIVGDINTSGNLDQSVDMLEELRAFINNGKYKIYKDRKGSAFKVKTHPISRSMVNDSIISQPNMIHFTWEQVGEVE